MGKYGLRPSDLVALSRVRGLKLSLKIDAPLLFLSHSHECVD